MVKNCLRVVDSIATSRVEVPGNKGFAPQNAQNRDFPESADLYAFAGIDAGSSCRRPAKPGPRPAREEQKTGA
jgi:hypothetical protein